MRMKTISRAEWQGIEGRMYAYSPFEALGLRGSAGLMRMTRVDVPFHVGSVSDGFNVTGTGYDWLQLAPEGENFWFTVMFDDSGRLFEYYIDMTIETHALPDGQAWFIDGILDYVMSPDGQIELLDEKELASALKTNKITPAEYARIICAAERVFSLINENEPALRSACESIRNSLLPFLR